MDIIELYKSILNCAGMTVVDDDFISIKYDTIVDPVLIDGKRLVLPTQKQLTSGDWKDRMVFHPLSEHIMRGESEVIANFRKVFNIRLNYTFGAIANSLLQIIGSVDEHKNLNPEQSKLLSAVGEVDDTTMTAFTSLMINAIKEIPEKAFINIFIKRGGMIGTKKFSRVSVVSFPFYEELMKDQEKYYGVKLRNKDRQVFIQLCKYMLPDLDVAEKYNYGSDSQVAPYLHALMGAVMGMGGKFNDILDLFGVLIDKHEDLEFNSDWVEAFEDLPSMVPQIRAIPMQQGNEGKMKITEAAPVAPVQTAQPLQTFQPPQQQAPQQFIPQVQHQQPYNPYQPQPQVPQNNGLVMTKDGLDFNSVMRNNPALAARALPVGHPQQQFMQQERPPTWAFPQHQQHYNPYQQQQQPQMYQQPTQQFMSRV